MQVQPKFGLPNEESEMRSHFPWASHVLPLLVFALAALAVGKLDQFADLMENWLSKLQKQFFSWVGF